MKRAAITRQVRENDFVASANKKMDFCHQCIGFTLVEMVVVVAIIGLILASVAVRFDSITASARLRSNAREIASTIGLAHSQASSTGRSHNIVFDTENCQYWVESNLQSESGDWLPKKRVLYDDVSFEDIQVGEDIYGESGSLSIEISPLGVTSAFMVHLESENGAKMTLEICPLTGLVRFFEGYKEYEPPESG